MRKSTLCFLLSLVCFLGIGLMVEIWESPDYVVSDEVMGVACGIPAIASIFVFLPLGFIFRAIEKSRKRQALPQEELEKIEADKQRRREDAQERRERMIADRTIVSTAIVHSNTTSKQKASVTSSVVRASVGGLVSPGWALVGALTPTRKTTTKTKDVTFSIRYASGRCTTEKVKFGSLRYNELAKYLA